jgi:hypothetical protein
VCCAQACITGFSGGKICINVHGSTAQPQQGGPCHDALDCVNPFIADPTKSCVGYVCMTNTCGPRDDGCGGIELSCGSEGGVCLRPVDGGASRCGTGTGSCGGCSSHADCAGFGPGAFCANDATGGCGCPTFCALPR